MIYSGGSLCLCADVLCIKGTKYRKEANMKVTRLRMGHCGPVARKVTVGKCRDSRCECAAIEKAKLMQVLCTLFCSKNISVIKSSSTIVNRKDNYIYINYSETFRK